MGMMMKAVILLLVVFSLISSISLAGYSFTQVQSKELGGINICEANNVQLNFPIRIYSNSTQDGKVVEVYGQCPWATKNNAIRVVIGIVGFLLSCVLGIMVVKGKTGRSIVLAVLLLGLGAAGIYSAIIDGMNLKDSDSFCETAGNCTTKPFIITILLDVLNAVLLAVSAIVLIRFRKNIHHHHHHEDEVIPGSVDEKIETTPLVGNDHSASNAI
ncbi:hypothetical protein DLAC_05568 [Tieghemostelium lacteum]|uniref:Transmembrane protein n=1 Tax=Tieghemostelium lacteum TaxID=361077 RepID=A0A151ZGB5_TIELA|nr:hypothetical protein DLAC_05568 [Tieghemostelium lacteum]|eukprot:KYQ92967.1 hypothetical protein DLAC_05568 [Tieghemostelium lacteum]